MPGKIPEKYRLTRSVEAHEQALFEEGFRLNQMQAECENLFRETQDPRYARLAHGFAKLRIELLGLKPGDMQLRTLQLERILQSEAQEVKKAQLPEAVQGTFADLLQQQGATCGV